MQGSAFAVDLLPAGLRDLAASATRRETWPRLRKYAQAQTSPEWSGWAYFLLGYQEYEVQRYSEAAGDLSLAARSGFVLADYAAYYQASALSQATRPQDAAAVLREFPARFPHSHLRDRAFSLLATSLVGAKQEQQAVEVLLSEPETHKQPALLMLLGHAYLQSHRLVEAAKVFQDVCYGFPASSQAEAAADALQQLRTRLGSGYPIPSAESGTARAEALISAGHYDDALKDYDELLKGDSANPLFPRWQLGQARCLVRLHRSADALQALFTHFTAPDMEAQRLALLVQVHAQQSDILAMTQVLAEMETSYQNSPTYADALSAAGIFYYRQLNWQEAARAYRRLYELFPQNDHLRDDGWRLAWCDYLLSDPSTSDVIGSYLRWFPDSSHAPAALYWLARIQEDKGSLGEARSLYALLIRRFVHSYYEPQAATRMAAIGLRQATPAATDDSTAAPLAAALIPVLTPPAIPQNLACLSTAPTDAARPALILQAMDLKSLEADFLKAIIAANNPPAELRLLLAEMSAATDNTAGALFGAMRTAPAYSRLEFSDLPEEVWNFLYPQAYRKLIEPQARLNNLDPYLVMGLIRQESAFNHNALSTANARGLMQILPETAAQSNRPARARAAARRLYDPTYNIQVGCAYLAGLLKEFDGRPELAMAAYNAGDFRVKDWVKKSSIHDPALFLESIPIPATRTYVELVLRDAEVYRQLMSGSPHFAECH
jgi:soluble lytic murein transglycosylase